MLVMVIRGAAAFSLLVVASLGASAQQPSPSAPSQGQMPMEHGKGGMMNDMHKMHQGSGTPPSSLHAPTPQGGPASIAPQCPAGTTLQMDDKSQHVCR